jgi:mRNA interferase RelE/StbE
LTKSEIFVSTTASKELNKLESKTKERIKRKVREILADPSNSKGRFDIKKLAGKKRTYYRLRVGDYRIIYFLEDNMVKVVRVATGSDAYPWLE